MRGVPSATRRNRSSSAHIPIQQQWRGSHPDKGAFVGSYGILIEDCETLMKPKTTKTHSKKAGLCPVGSPSMVLAADPETALCPSGLNCSLVSLWSWHPHHPPRDPGGVTINRSHQSQSWLWALLSHVTWLQPLLTASPNCLGPGGRHPSMSLRKAHQHLYSCRSWSNPTIWLHPAKPWSREVLSTQTSVGDMSISAPRGWPTNIRVTADPEVALWHSSPSGADPEKSILLRNLVGHTPICASEGGPTLLHPAANSEVALKLSLASHSCSLGLRVNLAHPKICPVMEPTKETTFPWTWTYAGALNVNSLKTVASYNRNHDKIATSHSLPLRSLNKLTHLSFPSPSYPDGYQIEIMTQK